MIKILVYLFRPAVWLLALGILLMLWAVFLWRQPADERPVDAAGVYREGVHYVELAEPFDRPHNHVQAWFWWGCPHCYAFEAQLTAWQERRGDALRINHRPVPGSSARDRHAGLYLAAEALGVHDRLHMPFFKLVQTEALQVARIDRLLIESEVDPEAFWAEYHRSGARLKALRIEASRAGIQEVPALVVGGRYRILGRSLDSFEAMIAVAEYLISLEEATHAAD